MNTELTNAFLKDIQRQLRLDGWEYTRYRLPHQEALYWRKDGHTIALSGWKHDSIKGERRLYALKLNSQYPEHDISTYLDASPEPFDYQLKLEETKDLIIDFLEINQ